MPAKSKRKSVGREFLDMFMGSVAESIGENVDSIVDSVADITKLKKHFKKYFVFSMLGASALVVFLLGLAMFLSESIGMNQSYVLMILGIIVFLIGWLYRKFS